MSVTLIQVIEQGLDQTWKQASTHDQPGAAAVAERNQAQCLREPVDPTRVPSIRSHFSSQARKRAAPFSWRRRLFRRAAETHRTFTIAKTRHSTWGKEH